MKLQGKTTEELEDIKNKMFSDIASTEVGSEEWNELLNTFIGQFVHSDFTSEVAFICLQRMASISNKFILLTCYGDGDTGKMYGEDEKTPEEFEELKVVIKKLEKLNNPNMIPVYKKFTYMKSLKDYVEDFDTIVIGI